tara:strand:+ start:6094 stop:7479 length:1386 start_codon:yes stop_codon:yes gene_type:complete
MARILPSLGRVFAADTKTETLRAGPSERSKSVSEWTKPGVLIPLADMAIAGGVNLYDKWDDHNRTEAAVDEYRASQKGLTVKNLVGASRRANLIGNMEFSTYEMALNQFAKHQDDRSWTKLREQASEVLRNPNISAQQKDLVMREFFPEDTEGWQPMSRIAQEQERAAAFQPREALQDPKGVEMRPAFEGISTMAQGQAAAAQANTMGKRAEAIALISRAIDLPVGTSVGSILGGEEKAKAVEATRKLFPHIPQPRGGYGQRTTIPVNETRLKTLDKASDNNWYRVERKIALADSTPEWTIQIPYKHFKNSTSITIPNMADEALVVVALPIDEKRRAQFARAVKEQQWAKLGQFELELNNGYLEREEAFRNKKKYHYLQGKMGATRSKARSWRPGVLGAVDASESRKLQEGAAVFGDETDAQRQDLAAIEASPVGEGGGEEDLTSDENMTAEERAKKALGQ